MSSPVYGEQPESAFVVVGFPPPAPRPEIIPTPPSKTAVWIDGEWRWRANRWHWVLGRWVEPPAPDAVFARSALRYDETGQLHFAPGTWRNGEGKALPHPESKHLANTTSGDVVEETGVLEDVGPNRRAHRERRRNRPPLRIACAIHVDCPLEGERDRPRAATSP